MNDRVNELIERIRRLEDEVEAEFRERRAQFHADFEQRKVKFEEGILEQQRRFRVGILPYLVQARLRNVVTAPVIYAVSVSLLLVDLFATLYQWVCFPAYGIARVRRRDYFVFDRSHLAYLNAIEKFNCLYCSYGNGLAAYLREIVARTEQYWCPIKHARRILAAHSRYRGFVDYGDAESYRRDLESLRAALGALRSSNGRNGQK